MKGRLKVWNSASILDGEGGLGFGKGSSPDKSPASFKAVTPSCLPDYSDSTKKIRSDLCADVKALNAFRAAVA